MHTRIPKKKISYSIYIRYCPTFAPLAHNGVHARTLTHTPKNMSTLCTLHVNAVFCLFVRMAKTEEQKKKNTTLSLPRLHNRDPCDKTHTTHSNCMHTHRKCVSRKYGACNCGNDAHTFTPNLEEKSIDCIWPVRAGVRFWAIRGLHSDFHCHFPILIAAIKSIFTSRPKFNCKKFFCPTKAHRFFVSVVVVAFFLALTEKAEYNPRSLPHTHTHTPPRRFPRIWGQPEKTTTTTKRPQIASTILIYLTEAITTHSSKRFCC